MSNYNLWDIDRKLVLLSMLLKDSSSEIKQLIHDIQSNLCLLNLTESAIWNYMCEKPLEFISFIERFLRYQEETRISENTNILMLQDQLKSDKDRRGSLTDEEIDKMYINTERQTEKRKLIEDIRAKLKSMTE